MRHYWAFPISTWNNQGYCYRNLLFFFEQWRYDVTKLLTCSLLNFTLGGVLCSLFCLQEAAVTWWQRWLGVQTRLCFVVFDFSTSRCRCSWIISEVYGISCFILLFTALPLETHCCLGRWRCSRFIARSRLYVWWCRLSPFLQEWRSTLKGCWIDVLLKNYSWGSWELDVYNSMTRHSS